MGLAYFYWQSLVLQAQLDEQAQRANSSVARSEENTRRASASSETLSPSSASASAAKHKMSSTNLEETLASLESLRLPGMRVSSAAVDLQEGSTRLDLDAATIDQVTASLALLQAADSAARWHLVNARAAIGGQRFTATFETQSEAAVASKTPATRSGSEFDRDRSK